MDNNTQTQAPKLSNATLVEMGKAVVARLSLDRLNKLQEMELTRQELLRESARLRRNASDKLADIYVEVSYVLKNNN